MKSYKEFREAKSDVPTVPADPLPHDYKLVEEIASLLHDQWMDLTKGLIKKGEITQETQDRWNRECMKPYAKLSDRMKEIDRVFARRIVSHLEIRGYATK